MTERKVLEKRYYLAFQDGRAEGEKEYMNYGSALQSLKTYSKSLRNSMCIKDYWIEIERISTID